MPLLAVIRKIKSTGGTGLYTPLLICSPTTVAHLSRHYSSPHSPYKGTVHIHHILSLDVLKTGDLYNLINFESIPSNHICSGSLHSFTHQAHKSGLHFQDEHPSNKPTAPLSYFPWSTEGSFLPLLPVSLLSLTIWNALPYTQRCQNITAVPHPSLPDGLNTAHRNDNDHCTEK